MIKALKKAEETDEYVVRVYETEGRKAQSATLTFAGKIISASEANGTEKTIGNATFEGNKLQVNITPYSVRTYKVRLKPSGREASPIEYAALPLDYDRKCASYNEFRGEGDFESGYSFAAELLPDSLIAGQITFRLGEKRLRTE